jgi:hypothetical protein
MVKTMRASLLLLAFALFGSSACSSSSSSPAPSATADAGGSAPTDDAGSSGGDTWASYASGFATTYCVACHDAKDPKGRDYTLLANVQKEKNEVRCGVAVTQDPSWGCAAFPPAKQFPIGTGAKPTDADRARFVAWLTAGAP